MNRSHKNEDKKENAFAAKYELIRDLTTRAREVLNAYIKSL